MIGSAKPRTQWFEREAAAFCVIAINGMNESHSCIVVIPPTLGRSKTKQNDC